MRNDLINLLRNCNNLKEFYEKIESEGLCFELVSLFKDDRDKDVIHEFGVVEGSRKEDYCLIKGIDRTGWGRTIGILVHPYGTHIGYKIESKPKK